MSPPIAAPVSPHQTIILMIQPTFMLPDWRKRSLSVRRRHVVTIMLPPEKVVQKLTRYKEICSDCGKFVRWIPNKEALEMGLQL